MVNSRKWFLTENNYPDESWEMAQAEILNCSYGLCCREIGDGGTKHIHIWLHYKNARNFSSIKKKFKRANIQEGKGTDQDQSYLKKDGDYLEHGEMEKQGKRNDIHKVKELIKNGGSMSDVIEESNSYQAIRGAELLFKYIEPKRPIKPIEVIWYFGTAGAGKTKKVFDTEVEVFRPTSYKWWEGYDNHKCVLVDDWRPSWCSFDNLLKLTDIYPFRIQTKGGSRQVQYEKIYFTSHLPPRDYFPCIEDDEYKQLERRITVIEEF